MSKMLDCLLWRDCDKFQEVFFQFIKANVLTNHIRQGSFVTLGEWEKKQKSEIEREESKIERGMAYKTFTFLQKNRAQEGDK